MKNRIVKVLLVVLIVVGAKLWFFPTKRAQAAPQEVFGACVANIPQEWGEFVGGSEQSGIAFRDNDPTGCSRSQAGADADKVTERDRE